MEGSVDDGSWRLVCLICSELVVVLLVFDMKILFILFEAYNMVCRFVDV